MNLYYKEFKYRDKVFNITISMNTRIGNARMLSNCRDSFIEVIGEGYYVKEGINVIFLEESIEEFEKDIKEFVDRKLDGPLTKAEEILVEYGFKVK